jgi:hypothetical protein
MTQPKQWNSGTQPEAVVDDVAAGEHHAFREPGRSRRVLHVDHVIQTAAALCIVEIDDAARPTVVAQPPVRD